MQPRRQISNTQGPVQQRESRRHLSLKQPFNIHSLTEQVAFGKDSTVWSTKTGWKLKLQADRLKKKKSKLFKEN